MFFTEPLVVADIEKALGLSHVRWCPGEYMDAAKEVMSTITFHPLDDTPELNLVQLAESFNPADIIMRVDFGLCQIGADVLGVTSTEAYARDKANQTLTLTRAETVEGVRRSLRRYERLAQKYTDWTLVVPREFVGIVDEAGLLEFGPEGAFDFKYWIEN